jgi:hypothetical protein
MNPIDRETVVECSICLDQIEGEKNKVVTDCNHCFHSKCLLKNIFHNGFGCPYCRTAMAEIPEENDSDDSEDEYDDWTADVVYDNYALQGMRMLFQRAEGEEVEEYGAYEEDDLEFEDEEEEEEEVKPSVDYIVEKLIQRGVTMRDLVSSCLIGNHEEYQSEEQLHRTDGEVFGKMRIIISNYVPPVALALEDEDDNESNEGTLLDSDLEEDIDCDSDSGSELDDNNDSGSEKESSCIGIPNPDCIAKEFDKYMSSYYQDQRALRYEKILDESIVDFNSQPKTRSHPFTFQMRGKTSRVN